MAVTTAQVKLALRIDFNDDDTELSRLISAATSWVERYTGLTLTQASRTMFLREFERTVFAVQPFVSLTSVVYTDPAGASVTLTSGTDYYLDTSKDLTALEFINSPEMKAGTLATVTYVAGYSSEPNEVAHAIIGLVGAWYNNPEAMQPITLTAPPLGAQFMLEHLRVRGLFA